MATSKLLLYNNALGILGERKLASLSEEREPRRILDDIWEADAIDYCLSMGFWRFALRTLELNYEPSINPGFGYSRAFSQPEDMVALVGISADEYFSFPLYEYVNENRMWFCDFDLLYVRFVSNDQNFGGDYSKWSPSFTRWVEQYLASRAALRITGETEKAEYHRKISDKLLKDAKSKDALGDPSKVPPPGTWSASRVRNTLLRRDRGNRHSLLG